MSTSSGKKRRLMPLLTGHDVEEILRPVSQVAVGAALCAGGLIDGRPTLRLVTSIGNPCKAFPKLFAGYLLHPKIAVLSSCNRVLWPIVDTGTRRLCGRSAAGEVIERNTASGLRMFR